MKRVAAVLVVIFAITLAPGAAPDDEPTQPADQEGVEVLTRGPIHEAFATPFALDPKPMPIIPRKPPEPVEEVPPTEKPQGNSVIWIGGYWAWDDEEAEFNWVSGIWRAEPPGKDWVPGRWIQHDGGWQRVPGYWKDEEDAHVTYVPPPPTTLETGPAAPAPYVDSFYVPGCWLYTQYRFAWRPGFWLGHRPHWVYVPAHYVPTPYGYLFIEGHWDYDFANRGLLFAPVRIAARWWGAPGWRYYPHYVVYADTLFDSLFVRVGYGSYYFGDYFAPGYAPYGFVFWFDYRPHRYVPDPIYVHHHWHHRATPHWEKDLRRLYDDRRAGNAPRPPRSLTQQHQFVKDITEHKTITTPTKVMKVDNAKAALKSVQVVAPLTKAKTELPGLKLQTLSKPAHAQELTGTMHQEASRFARSKLESRITKFPATPTDPATVHNWPKYTVRKTPIVPNQPPAPIVPRVQSQPLPKFEPRQSIRVPSTPYRQSIGRPPIKRGGKGATDDEFSQGP